MQVILSVTWSSGVKGALQVQQSHPGVPNAARDSAGAAQGRQLLGYLRRGGAAPAAPSAGRRQGPGAGALQRSAQALTLRFPLGPAAPLPFVAKVLAPALLQCSAPTLTLRSTLWPAVPLPAVAQIMAPALLQCSAQTPSLLIRLAAMRELCSRAHTRLVSHAAETRHGLLLDF